MKHSIVAILMLSCYLPLRGADVPVERLTYDQFIQAVEAGEITHVRFYNLSGIEGEVRRSDGIKRFDLSHVVQPNLDPLLLRLLQSKGITSEQISDSTTWERSDPWFFYGITPLGSLLFIGLIIMVFIQWAAIKRLERQANQALQTTPMARSAFEKTKGFEGQSRGV